MNSQTSAERQTAADGHPRTGAFVLFVAIIVTFQASSAVPTALYDRYTADWHLSPTDITVAFGTYAVALLAALLVFGRLSDFIGRRLVLAASIAGQLLANALLLGAHGFGLLLAGRVLQGLATGAGIGAASAGCLDVNPRQGGVANAAAPLTGSALGAILAAVAVQLLPLPERLSYIVVLALFVLEAVLLVLMDESGERRGGALASLRPKIALPADARTAFIAAAPVVFSVYALAGLFGSLGPSLTAKVTGSSSIILDVLPFVLLSAASPVVSIAVREWPPARALALGVGGLVIGVLLTGAAVLASSLALLIIGSIVSGIGFGAGFRGGLQLVVSEVSDSEYGGSVSLVYVAAYLGFGIPAIVAGVVDSETHAVGGTALGYSGVLLGLAVIAGLALTRVRSPSTGPRS